MRRALYIAFFFEIGVALMIVPWSAFWDRNYFAQAQLLHEIITNNFVRGAVSGLGVVNIVAGLREIVGILLARSAHGAATPLSGARLTKE